VSGSLIGGHCQLGDHVTVGGNTAVHQFVRIGSFSLLAGCSAVVQDVPPFALTDRFGRVAGVNWIGLQRAGFSSDAREEIKAAYRLLYRSGLSANQVVRMLSSHPHTPAIAPIIEFLGGESVRGLCRGSSRLSAE
jgi:UDP-N-acetylglucosamine acyltransferase